MESALALARLEALLLSGQRGSAEDAEAYALGRALCAALEDLSVVWVESDASVEGMEETVSPSRPVRLLDRHQQAQVWRQQLVSALAAACAEPDLHRRLRLRARALVRTLTLLDALEARPVLSAETLAYARALYNHLDMVCRGQRAPATVREVQRQAAVPLLAVLQAA